jgi:hypothetical protein
LLAIKQVVEGYEGKFPNGFEYGHPFEAFDDLFFAGDGDSSESESDSDNSYGMYAYY